MQRLPTEAFTPNPVLLKELRSRMRGARAFIILTVFLVLLGAFSALLYQLVVSVMRSGGSGPVGAIIGQTLFGGLMMFELILILFLTPALTAGTLSREHEAQTFEMLIATPLRPVSIVAGKLLAAMSYVFLLIVAAIPFGSIFFLFGGVTVRDMLVAIGVLAAIAVTMGTLGVFWSALLRKTGRATVASYLTVAAFIFLPYFFYIAHGILQQAQPPRIWLVPSPFAALSSALTTTPALQNGPSMLFLVFAYGVSVAEQVLEGDVIRPTWQYTLWLYGAMASVAFLVTRDRLRPVGRQNRRRTAMVWLVLLLLLAIVAVVAFDGGRDWIELFRSP